MPDQQVASADETLPPWPLNTRSCSVPVSPWWGALRSAARSLSALGSPEAVAEHEACGVLAVAPERFGRVDVREVDLVSLVEERVSDLEPEHLRFGAGGRCAEQAVDIVVDRVVD